MTTLWALFVALQVFSAGNMNHQQEAGYYEINSIYGKHPSKERVYITKLSEVAIVYGVTKMFPKYKREILAGACGVSLGFIVYDNVQGIEMKVRF